MRPGLQIAAGLALVAAVLGLSVGLRLDDLPLDEAGHGLSRVLRTAEVGVSEAAAAPASPEPKDRKARIEQLACFDCHEIEAYWKGDTFPHRRHEKEMGKLHCHVCHAFEGHMATVTRKEGCGECHEEDEL